VKPSPVRSRYYRVGAQDSDMEYASKADAFSAADVVATTRGVLLVVYRVDVLETWTLVSVR
jgi:hypothetical protein